MVVFVVVIMVGTVQKVSKYEVFSGPYFPASGLNMETYGVNVRISSKYGKIQTRKNSIYGYFSRSEMVIPVYNKAL